MDYRFQDTPELFGGGSGRGTSGPVSCVLCGEMYNQNYDDEHGTVTWTEFAGLTVADCCFHVIENEIISRLPDLLIWARALLTSRAQRVAMQREDVDVALEALPKGGPA